MCNINLLICLVLPGWDGEWQIYMRVFWEARAGVGRSTEVMPNKWSCVLLKPNKWSCVLLKPNKWSCVLLKPHIATPFLSPGRVSGHTIVRVSKTSGRFRNLKGGFSHWRASTPKIFWVAKPTSGHVNASIKLEVFSEDIPHTVLWYYCGTKWPWGVSGITFGFMYPA